MDAEGNLTANGTGEVGPYHGVQATLTGRVNKGQLTGIYAIDTNGAIPGTQPITYDGC